MRDALMVVLVDIIASVRPARWLPGGRPCIFVLLAKFPRMSNSGSVEIVAPNSVRTETDHGSALLAMLPDLGFAGWVPAPNRPDNKNA